MISSRLRETLPPRWQLARCQDIIDVRDGTHDTPRYVSEGVPLVTSKNLSSGYLDFTDAFCISREDHEQIQKRSKVDRGDILFAMIGTIGNPVIVDTDREFSIKNVALFKFGGSQVSAKYFHYLLQSSLIGRQLSEDARGITQKFVSLKVLRNLQIPLPPLPEQQRIAAILAKADRLRRLRRTARELSDTVLQSVFLEMFGDPVSNPMGWDVTTLGKICSVIRDGVHKTPNYVPSGVPFVTVKNIVTGRLDFGDTKFISEDTHSELTKRVHPKREDILVSKDGTIGVPCVVETDRRFSIFVSVALLRPCQEIVGSVFLAEQIRSDGVQRQIREGTKGIAIRHLHLEDFKRLMILLPPIGHQREFVRIVRKFERLRAQQREAERQTEHLFQTLLERAFRGEV